MKLRNRCYLYFSLIGIIPFLGLLLGFLLFNQDARFFDYMNQSNWPIRNLFVAFLIFIAADVFIIVRLSRLFFHSTIDRINEINDHLRASRNNEIPALRDDRGGDEVSELRRSVIAMQQYTEKSRIELEENLHQLQLSKMNLEEKYAQSYTLKWIHEEISRELDIDKLLKKMPDIIIGVLGSKNCIIYTVDDERDCLVPRAEAGFPAGCLDCFREISLNSDNIIAKSCCERKVLMGINDDASSTQYLSPHILAIPLTRRDGCVGSMVIGRELEEKFNQDLIEFAELIAQELSLSFENAYLYGKMRQMAIRDGLTGAYNRVFLMNYMAEVFDQHLKYVSVIILDIDHFKQINDKYGHLAGDCVLKALVAIIQKMLPTGMLARYGGEEFVIVFPDLPQEEAYILAESARRLIEVHNFMIAEGVSISVTISAGLANYPLVSANYERLLQLADGALYEAKRAGRNKVCLAVPEDQT